MAGQWPHHSQGRRYRRAHWHTRVRHVEWRSKLRRHDGPTSDSWVWVDHRDAILTVYAHLSEILVVEGQAVTSDEILGLSGESGNATGPHLHFEIRGPRPPGGPRRNAWRALQGNDQRRQDGEEGQPSVS